MAQAIKRGTGKESIGREGLVPLREVEVAGDHRGGGFVAFGDEVAARRRVFAWRSGVGTGRSDALSGWRI